jgi:hypothetical protein
MYMFKQGGKLVASKDAKHGPANSEICAPAELKMTVPFSSAALTSSNVMRASSNESPLGLDTL